MLNSIFTYTLSSSPFVPPRFSLRWASISFSAFAKHTNADSPRHRGGLKMTSRKAVKYLVPFLVLTLIDIIGTAGLFRSLPFDGVGWLLLALRVQERTRKGLGERGNRQTKSNRTNDDCGGRFGESGEEICNGILRGSRETRLARKFTRSCTRKRRTMTMSDVSCTRKP